MTTKLPTALERAALAVEASGGMPYIESQLPSVPSEYRTFNALPTAPLITSSPLSGTINNELKQLVALPTASEVFHAPSIVTSGGWYGSTKVRPKPTGAGLNQKGSRRGLRVRRRKARPNTGARATSATTSTGSSSQKEAQKAKGRLPGRVKKSTGHPKPTWLKKYQFKKGGK